MAQVAAAVAVAAIPPPSPVQANATTITTPADIDTKAMKIMMKMMNKMTTTGNLGGGNPADVERQPTNDAAPINQETKTRM